MRGASVGFNPRSRAGSDLGHSGSLMRIKCFNPRSRAGSDSLLMYMCRANFWFQSTLPRGERHLIHHRDSCSCNSFNPRSRAGSDFLFATRCIIHIGFQSTLPRGERRAALLKSFTVANVSIHAPARGATLLKLRSVGIMLFQSTLPRGERRSRPSMDMTICWFQSTLPRGERHALHVIQAKGWPFQSTLPRGERLSFTESITLLHMFQSTLPRGERQLTAARPSSKRRFNPRSRAGSDDNLYCIQGIVDVSIHAPARGATYRIGSHVHRLYVSIHAPARGATSIGLKLPPLSKGFNPRSRAGSDRASLTLCLDQPVSIHAPARGATERIPYARK